MLSELFQQEKPVIGIIQLLPLPGAPDWNGRVEEVVARAEQEAAALTSGGVDGLLIENTYDFPYRRGQIDRSGAIAMALIAKRVQQYAGDLPIGVSVLENDPETALAIAMNVDAAFVRIPVLIGSMIREGGMIQGKLNEVVDTLQSLKLKKAPRLFVDISMNNIVPTAQREAPWVSPTAYLEQVTLAVKKHQLADALIYSDREVKPEHLEALKAVAELPVFVGDQMTPERASAYYKTADGLILGSGIKKSPIEGIETRTTVDLMRVEELMAALAQGQPTPGGTLSIS